MSIITQNAVSKIRQFNDMGLHYNLATDGIDKARQRLVNTFDKSFIPYIIAGLISFDMARMMGKNKYSLENGFAKRLSSKLRDIRPLLVSILSYDIMTLELRQHDNVIKGAYDILASAGNGALHEDNTKAFHVGATKILHFLHPDLFIIIDSNAARAYRKAFNVHYVNSTQPGFSKEKYIECMICAKQDIEKFGLQEFQALEPATPITRIYDKLTFVTGMDMK